MHFSSPDCLVMRAAQKFSRAEFDTFFDEFDGQLRKQEEEKRRLNRAMASSFTVFRFLRMNENLASDIFAFLLNPSETHGQEDLFLRLMTRYLDLPSIPDLSAARVQREALTYTIDRHLRRIDILVTMTTGRLVLAIEHKINAKEGVEQLGHYYEHVKRIAPHVYCLIFLTPDGRPPQSIDAKTAKALRKSGKLKELSYCELLEWLLKCHKECKPEVIRRFIANLIDYLRTHIPPSSEE